MTIPNMQEKNDIQTTHDVSPQTIASNIVALDVGQKTVLLNFNGGFLSSDAGALLLREVGRTNRADSGDGQRHS